MIAGTAGLVSVSPAQAVEGGTATCDALDVALSGSFLDTVFLDVTGGTDTVVAPDPDNGTNDGGLSGTIDESGTDGSVTIDVLNCEATRADDFLDADADIASGAVTVGGVEVATLGTITSDVLCPAAGTGDPTASASAGLTVGGEAINLSTGGQTSAEGTVDLVIADVLEGVVTVSASTSASSDDDSAQATGLQLVLTFSGAALGESVVLTLGTVTVAETTCTVGAADDDGTDDGIDDDGDDDGIDDDGDDDGIDDDGDDDGIDDDGDDDGIDDDGTDGDDDGAAPGAGGTGSGGGTLPATGNGSWQVAVLAFGTLLAGVAAIAVARRRPAA